MLLGQSGRVVKGKGEVKAHFRKKKRKRLDAHSLPQKFAVIFVTLKGRKPDDEILRKGGKREGRETDTLETLTGRKIGSSIRLASIENEIVVSGHQLTEKKRRHQTRVEKKKEGTVTSLPI